MLDIMPCRNLEYCSAMFGSFYSPRLLHCSLYTRKRAMTQIRHPVGSSCQIVVRSGPQGTVENCVPEFLDASAEDFGGFWAVL